MPKIFEYLGYFLFIYTDDHPPVHIHVQHGEYRAKAELLYEDGVLSHGYVALQCSLKNNKLKLGSLSNNIKLKLWTNGLKFTYTDRRSSPKK